ncbi:MAG: hypothetical protein KatS3mg022_2944 [Armatimonadota bacterium]|nr:MAG: hypothetical protein KatS3mg022_2944 [Armatimonadota bacterium]
MKSHPPHILLDKYGDAIVPEGYLVIDDEVAFLEHALCSERLFIRGKHLCEWAERFYRGRQIAYKEVSSPRRTLIHICPQLSEEQAHHIALRLVQSKHVPQNDWSVTDILSRLYPEARWYEPLSVEHAAWWLVWLQETSSSEAEQVVLCQQSYLWSDRAEERLQPVYRAYNAETARRLMEEWLCLTQRTHLGHDLPPFPLPLPAEWKRRLHAIAREWYVRASQQVSDYLRNRAVAPEAKQIVAEEGATYYLHHTDLLTRETAEVLFPYLSPERRRQIEQLIPPEEPSPFGEPQDVASALKWAVEQYLPYRRWVMEYGNDSQRQKSEEIARQFIYWLLEFYPRALQAGDDLQRWFVFRRVRRLLAPDYLTLLVVLDGLGWQDALELHSRIVSLSEDITALEPHPALSALPTITPFAKPAILRGECPRFALDEQNPVPEVGELLPEGNIPIERLRQAKAGECLLWRVNEPDKTYHERYDTDTLAHDVAAELDNLAGKIVEALRAMPAGVPGRIVVTSDHGRMFGYSNRRYHPPAGMQAKGRAAWGSCTLPFDERGYLVDEKNALIYLHPERFGLAHPVAVPLDADMFVAEGGKGGGERFAHGGIHPEEVIVPWLVYVREVQAPRLQGKVIVRGQVGREGSMQLQIANLEQYSVQLHALQLVMGEQQWHSLPVAQETAALSRSIVDLVLPKLPAKAQWQRVHAKLQVVANEIPFAVQVEIVDETREMYRTTDLLEDLQ